MSLLNANRGLRFIPDYFKGLVKSVTLNARFLRSTSSLHTEGEERLRKILEEKLQPSYLHIKDISGVLKSRKKKYILIFILFIKGGCGSMYEIVIDSTEFKGKRPVQQHRLVNEVGLRRGGIH